MNKKMLKRIIKEEFDRAVNEIEMKPYDFELTPEEMEIPSSLEGEEEEARLLGKVGSGENVLVVSQVEGEAGEFDLSVNEKSSLHEIVHLGSYDDVSILLRVLKLVQGSYDVSHVIDHVHDVIGYEHWEEIPADEYRSEMLNRVDVN